MRRLQPAETTETIFDIDYERLRESGKRTLLFDLDNTLGRRGMRHLPEYVSDFLRSLLDRGFAVGIITNRRRNADAPAVRTLSALMPVIHAAGKPRRRGFLDLLDRLGGAPEDAVMIGDRRLTDILGANRLGIHSILVRSTRHRDPRVKREAPVS
jgi:HAD superfamily phosphatase (TIGR01668 family)